MCFNADVSGDMLLCKDCNMDQSVVHANLSGYTCPLCGGLLENSDQTCLLCKKCILCDEILLVGEYDVCQKHELCSVCLSPNVNSSVICHVCVDIAGWGEKMFNCPVCNNGVDIEGKLCPVCIQCLDC